MRNLDIKRLGLKKEPFRSQKHQKAEWFFIRIAVVRPYA
jgi:hypothetical protein